jgi:biotin transport system substrate-specific component
MFKLQTAYNNLTVSQTKAIQFLLGIFLLFAASQISIPLKPVPITLQTVAVMLIGLTYTPFVAVSTVTTWILAGALGLPVFAGYAAGIGGNTTGYLFGFICAVFVMSLIQQKYKLKSFIGISITCLIGTLIIFAFGIIWLAGIIGLKPALTFGVLPFILPGMVKIVVLSSIIKFCRIKD